MNVFEYLISKPNELMGKCPKEMDLFIFALLTYTKFEFLLKDKKRRRRLTIGKYCDYYLKELNKNHFGKEEHHRLINAIKNNPRYIDVRIVQLIAHFDTKEEKQYASITFRIGKNYILSFRGTDSTLTGWKEDINLAVQDVVPSEIIATEVLDHLLKRHPFSKVYLSGHSKGGVLALYAASHILESRQKRIVGVKEYDGPGLKFADIASSNYMCIVSRIHGYIPEHSVIGMIFHKKHQITMIKSSQKGFMEHDPFSWIIEKDHLLTLEKYQSREDLKPGFINKIMSTLTDKEMKDYIEKVYAITNEDRVVTLPEFTKKDKIKNILYRYQKLNPEDRKMVRKLTWKIISGTYREF